MVDPNAVNTVATAIVDTWLANLLQGLILLIASGTGLGIVFVFKSLGVINVHLAKLNGRTRSMEDLQNQHTLDDQTVHRKFELDIERIDKHIIDELIARAHLADPTP